MCHPLGDTVVKTEKIRAWVETSRRMVMTVQDVSEYSTQMIEATPLTADEGEGEPQDEDLTLAFQEDDNSRVIQMKVTTRRNHTFLLKEIPMSGQHLLQYPKWRSPCQRLENCSSNS